MGARIGHGYDLHKLTETGSGRPFRLGGVPIAAQKDLVGHSDADVLMHAITDALLGAIGSDDLGTLFPDTSEAHDGEDSSVYLLEAVRRVSEAGYRIGNVDATVVCEFPKVGPHRGAIAAKLAGLMGVDASDVNVKGKTHEGVDAIGQGDAVEVHCVVLLESEG